MSEPPKRTVVINGRIFEVALPELSQLQIRTLANLSPDDDLILEVSGGADRVLAPDERVELSSDVIHIFSRPQTSFG
ncbi:multiubiquitin domain-containing protein [Mesorhizobium sp.]|uniref:multiubiquitin domain-containing protein n=1 Tax=Mesorhizobium sp. TaxID=1871066 RepID=UPI0025E4B682|nr:multiubiquitin domain-containing protein [Mesorhizobium sp.]